MTSANKILFRSFVKPFYRENASLFLFVFTMMFFIVNKVDGAELLEYHYSLILATLKSTEFLCVVFFIWLLYARKCSVYVSKQIKKPEFGYLNILNLLAKPKRFTLFFLLETWLLLPILIYALFIVLIGIRQNYYLSALLVVSFLVVIAFINAIQHINQLNIVTKESGFIWIKPFEIKWPSFYPSIVLRFIANEQKLLVAGLKIFTCSMLYFIGRNNTPADYDVKPLYLFYNFGILAHSILIHRLREFNGGHLSFYRSLPVSTGKRFLYYSIVYGFLLVPEAATIVFLFPDHLSYQDAAGFILSSYSLLLLLNSLTFIFISKMKEFLKILILVFFIQYFVIMIFGLLPLSAIGFVLSLVIFYKGFYRYEWVHSKHGA